jgi:hypothetical protein
VPRFGRAVGERSGSEDLGSLAGRDRHSPNFEQPNATPNSPSIGKITATLIDNREIQLALKLVF